MSRQVTVHPAYLLYWLFLSVCLVACGGTTSTATPTATAVPPTATPELRYDNPVFPRDFPDPHILRVDDTYYGYATNTAGANIPIIRSTNLITWERLPDALPLLPAWAALRQGLTWAPGAIQIGDTFVLYYTTRDLASDLQCISRAVSDSPEGPFTDDSTAALVCQTELGGSIDPYPFLDDSGQLYLFWKNDGNCCGLSVGLWVQSLSADGLSLSGEPVELIQRDQGWERPLIENPAMVEDNDTYYLFYSGNWWETHEYAVGYAVCDTITGPCEKPLSEPLFDFEPPVMGPGGESFFTDDAGNLWMAYHAWTGADVGYPAGERSLHLEPVTFRDGQPVIPGPTDDPQPLP
jgi:beta-xylosidase